MMEGKKERDKELRDNREVTEKHRTSIQGAAAAAAARCRQSETINSGKYLQRYTIRLCLISVRIICLQLPLGTIQYEHLTVHIVLYLYLS